MSRSVFLYAVCVVALVQPAMARTDHAEDATSSTSSAQTDTISVIADAQTLAPSSMPLDVNQPTSVIPSKFIPNKRAKSR